ncbi:MULTISPECIES: hypothetical protein [Micrococcaceae]|uniref:hypothetical protein n=1 Tax=Micrococcaceae TaxID=1268 RepID=UPI001616F9A2|nr:MULTISPECIES: hypothetical protein [Micrococcaceae]MBB5747790.1 hypothetical protein [Micrococcus sp. TA1]HRO30542.1 hypothetical protein [Citricoccus sp.]HRO93842.1 hypothetical protein [Citricoccus sp.]
MATSDDTTGGLGAFLVSRPNLVGLAAFLAVFIVVMLLSPSPLAAVIAGLLGYGAGYLLTPSTRRTYASGIPVHGATGAEMAERLAEFQQSVRANRGRIPPEADRELGVIVLSLREMIDRWQDVRRAPEQRMALESIVYQYLPNTLEVFLRLPDSAKPQAAPEWIAQLKLLGTEVAGSRTSVLQHDLEAMRANGRVLEQKFEDGDLRMFREHGL